MNLFSPHALGIALQFNGIDAGSVRFDCDRQVLIVEYVQRGTRHRRELTFAAIEAWFAANLPAMPAETAPLPHETR